MHTLNLDNWLYFQLYGNGPYLDCNFIQLDKYVLALFDTSTITKYAQIDNSFSE